MRLGQLARRLSLRPAQIVEFLAQQNIRIEEGSNTRMEDDHVMLVVKKYAPASLENIIEEADEEIVEEVVIENRVPVDEVSVSELKPAEAEGTVLPEVIRVPKIELSGLKVLGKIELPEPKKKEPGPEQIEETIPQTALEALPSKSSSKPQKPSRKATHQKRERQKGEWKNPLELQREREAREAEEKRRLAIEREKEKRKKYYEEKVKAIAQPKRVKPIKEETQINVKPVGPQPKTWLGRFWKWLRPD